MIQKYLEAGRIVNTHGLSGEVKFEHWCDSAEAAASVKRFFLDKDGKEALDVASCRPQGALLLLRFAQITSVDDAMKLKGHILYADRDDIPVPEGTAFISDLLGLPVIDSRTGEIYGVLSDVFNQGSNDIYEITKDGKAYLMPAVREFLIKTEINTGIFISPPSGIFDMQFTDGSESPDIKQKNEE